MHTSYTTIRKKKHEPPSLLLCPSLSSLLTRLRAARSKLSFPASPAINQLASFFLPLIQDTSPLYIQKGGAGKRTSNSSSTDNPA